MRKLIARRRYWWLSLAAGLILSILWLLADPAAGLAQSGRRPQPKPSVPTTVSPSKQPAAQPEEPEKEKPLADNTPVNIGDDGTIKLDTTLVTIPVSVTDRDGKFIPNLVKRDFHIHEDNIEQQIDSFQSVEVPFNVVLVLDTSNSTRFRLEDIQEAAVAFVNQLRADDRVMVVSFDSRVRTACEFTNDRARLREAIYQTRTGGSTKLYDAVDFVVGQLEKVEGRKAIVIFTDGVDTSSGRASAASTIEQVEESGALVYPISYDTEEAVTGGRGIPGNPGGRPPILTNPWPMPIPRVPSRRRWPLAPFINFQFPGQWPPQGRTPPGGSAGDYRRGARYLQELADSSGGRLYHAETIGSVSSAFTQIAEELRHQYSLSYYPTNGTRDGTFRAIKVRVNQPGYVVRARKGYKAAAQSK